MAAKKDKDMTALNARIPTELHRKLRVAAINRGATVQELVALGIRLVLGEKSEEDKLAAKSPKGGK